MNRAAEWKKSKKSSSPKIFKANEPNGMSNELTKMKKNKKKNKTHELLS